MSVQGASRTLLDRARRGERDALAELWRTYHPGVVRYLRSRRAVAPDDVASQVWIDVASAIGRFDGDLDDFRRWLFTIAHRRSVDSIRRSVRDGQLATRAADNDPGGHAEGADEAHLRRQSVDRAVAMIASLPEQMGAALMLRVVHELPVADVAQILDTTEGNVRVLVHRGTARLRRKLSVTDEQARTMKVVS